MSKIAMLKFLLLSKMLCAANNIYLKSKSVIEGYKRNESSVEGGLAYEDVVYNDHNKNTKANNDHCVEEPFQGVLPCESNFSYDDTKESVKMSIDHSLRNFEQNLSSDSFNIDTHSLLDPYKNVEQDFIDDKIYSSDNLNSKSILISTVNSPVIDSFIKQEVTETIVIDDVEATSSKEMLCENVENVNSIFKTEVESEEINLTDTISNLDHWVSILKKQFKHEEESSGKETDQSEKTLIVDNQTISSHKNELCDTFVEDKSSKYKRKLNNTNLTDKIYDGENDQLNSNYIIPVKAAKLDNTLFDKTISTELFDDIDRQSCSSNVKETIKTKNNQPNHPSKFIKTKDIKKDKWIISTKERPISFKYSSLDSNLSFEKLLLVNEKVLGNFCHFLHLKNINLQSYQTNKKSFKEEFERSSKDINIFSFDKVTNRPIKMDLTIGEYLDTYISSNVNLGQRLKSIEEIYTVRQLITSLLYYLCLLKFKDTNGILVFVFYHYKDDSDQQYTKYDVDNYKYLLIKLNILLKAISVDLSNHNEAFENRIKILLIKYMKSFHKNYQSVIKFHSSLSMWVDQVESKHQNLFKDQLAIQYMFYRLTSTITLRNIHRKDTSPNSKTSIRTYIKQPDEYPTIYKSFCEYVNEIHETASFIASQIKHLNIDIEKLSFKIGFKDE